jgi:hypothetical protein
MRTGERDSGMRAVMNDALRRTCEAIQKLLAQAAVEEIDTRYNVGVHIQTIVDAARAKTYGDRAVERLAEELGRDARSLYRYALVAKMVSEREMAALSRRANAHGEPLSWSHWVELTRARKAWRQWFERAVTESWSVRRLARELDAEVGTGEDEDDTEAEDTTQAALLENVRAVERLNLQMGSFGALLDRLGRSSRQPREVGVLLARADGVVRELARKSTELLARMSALGPSEDVGDRPQPRAREVEN